MSTIRYFDAHNHFQDIRLDRSRESIVTQLARHTVSAVVVNGTHEGDWPAVAELARRYTWVVPSFGVHPWYLDRMTSNWKATLEGYLAEFPFAVGEIGIDRWMKNPDVELQERIFLEQLELARARQVPVSIHCLKAWARLYELLCSVPLPSRGFLLHSYSGPVELVQPLVRLGAYFSCPGYFLAERKRNQLDTFKHVPPSRLLIETDAPDQLLPEPVDQYRLLDTNGRRLNHPANIVTIYESVATALGVELPLFASQIECNFHTLFGSHYAQNTLGSL